MALKGKEKLKGKEWFYKQCLSEIKQFSPLAHLSWDILEKGVGQKDKTRGHVAQAIGAVQMFLRDHPNFIATIRTADPTKPFDLGAYPSVLEVWRTWCAGQSGRYDRAAFGYDFDTLKGYLRPTLGGKPFAPGPKGGRGREGGRGDNEFKIVLRLMAEFTGRR